VEAIRATGGNVSRLASRLGVTRQTCYAWIYRLDLAAFVGVRAREDMTMPEQKQPLPGDKAERVSATVRVEGRLWRAVRIRAIEEDRTTSSIVEDAVRAYMARR
jgi:transposase-like protein